MCGFGLGSHGCVWNGDRHMSGIYQVYVLGIHMCGACINSLIRIALTVGRLLLEQLEAYLVV